MGIIVHSDSAIPISHLICIRSWGKSRLRSGCDGAISALDHSRLIKSQSLDLAAALLKRPQSQGDVVGALVVEDTRGHRVGGLGTDVIYCW